MQSISKASQSNSSTSRTNYSNTYFRRSLSPGVYRLSRIIVSESESIIQLLCTNVCHLSTLFFKLPNQFAKHCCKKNFKSKLTQEFLEWIGYCPWFSTPNHPAVCGVVVYQNFPLDLGKNVADYLKELEQCFETVESFLSQKIQHSTPNTTIFVVETSRS